MNASFRSCFLLACCFSLQQACLRAGLPACRALVVVGWAVGWVAPCMHACAARRCLHACRGSPPPRLSASTTGFLTPGPLAEPWRGLHVPGVPWVFVRLRTTRNAQKQAHNTHRGAGKAICTRQNTRGRGTRGKQTNQPLSCKGGPTCSHTPPTPPGTLAHSWHIDWHHQSLLACRSPLLSLPPCQIIQAATSAGRQAGSEQTPSSFRGDAFCSADSCINCLPVCWGLTPPASLCVRAAPRPPCLRALWTK